MTRWTGRQRKRASRSSKQDLNGRRTSASGSFAPRPASGRVGGVCKIIRAMPGEGADCHPLSFGMFFEGALLIVPCLYLIVP